MVVSFTPAYRALAVGGLAAAALIGAFALGTSQGSAATSPSGEQVGFGRPAPVWPVLTSATRGGADHGHRHRQRDRYP